MISIFKSFSDLIRGWMWHNWSQHCFLIEKGVFFSLQSNPKHNQQKWKGVWKVKGKGITKNSFYFLLGASNSVTSCWLTFNFVICLLSTKVDIECDYTLLYYLLEIFRSKTSPSLIMKASVKTLSSPARHLTLSAVFQTNCSSELLNF